MTTKTYVLLILAALLGGIYAYYFTDLINTPRIQIIKSNRIVQSRRLADGVYPVAFTLDGKYELTSVKVVSANALTTNKHPDPVWYLVTKSNTPPLHGFYYGQRIPGLAPATTNARAYPLAPGLPYRLYIEAGRAKGELEFTAQPVEGQ